MAPGRNARRSRGSSPRVYHLGLAAGELPECILLPGDPDRAERIARSWDSFEELHASREFRSFRGTLGGVPMGVVSAGVGGPSISIAAEELAAVGVKTFLRVGTCGIVDHRVRPGDLVISVAAARFEATSRAYAPPGYPAVADPAVVAALSDAATRARVRFHRGITATVETFYLDQGRRGYRGYRPVWFERTVPRLRALGILNIEMECATLFTIASVYGLRAGAVCTALGESDRRVPLPEDPGHAIDVANEAARLLSAAPRTGTAGPRRR